ncbi:AraC-like DNA-binding protein [Leeuwenhoekiella aestuarii]|uniref:AraC-like DNA-binding protein n=1 Tax=Leeuwenhoekiella aestuarii TaxID=2249426 RepID=A0A4Q0NXD3_9FLAO|nr:AraC-like DNA-binding protein [Leeuwenhoekiella aestuarii]RXG16644.1 AraC-like DNA-binding protein [Leeuwenhoekiella aestuarii]
MIKQFFAKKNLPNTVLVNLVLILFLNTTICIGQELQIEWKQKSLTFKQIKDSIASKYPDLELARPYAQMYLDKAKLKNDSLEIATGYDYLARLYDPLINIKYADSVILYSLNSKHKNFPTVGYQVKGYWLYQMGNYQEAIDAYLLAYNSAIEKNNIPRQIESVNAIVALKDRWGDSKESLILLKQQLKLIKNQTNYRTDFKEDYLYNLYNTTLSYQRNKQYDSASIFINKGIQESLALQDSLSYYDFVFTSGINLLKQKDFLKAKDSLEKSKPYIDNYRLQIYHSNLARVYKGLGDLEKYETHLKITDSLYEVGKDPSPDLRNIYSELADIYKSKGDVVLELKYINKQIAIDSVLTANENYISTAIVKKYDIPKLKSERDQLIKQLNDSKSSRTLENYSAISISVVLTLLLAYQFFKRYTYKKRFQHLMETRAGDSEDKKNSAVESASQALDISNELVAEILTKLEVFEKSKGFLNKDLKLSTLANQLETNSTYLSKTINAKKGKNFSTYLKDLRIEYAVKLLKSNRKLRSYTITAIAHEVGFKSSESFSKAFFSKTGIYPSYFIKQLNKADA